MQQAASTSTDQVRTLIREKFKVAETGDYFGVLGLARDASIAEVRKAYFGLAKYLHPDKLGPLGLEDMKEEAIKLFRVVTVAHETLSNPQKREEYLTGKLKAATPEKPQTQAAGPEQSVEEAKIAFHKGSVLLGKRAYPEAEKLFREATRLRPDVARYWQSLGWAIFNNEDARPTDRRLEQARKSFEQALELDSEDYRTHYCMGLYWKQMGKLDACKNEMQDALKNKPDFIEAQREIRLMEMREAREKTSPKPVVRQTTAGNILSRLQEAFKKKGK
jgi:DnaJ-class molecular chaperone